MEGFGLMSAECNRPKSLHPYLTLCETEWGGLLDGKYLLYNCRVGPEV